MSENPEKDPKEVDPERLLAELESRRLAFRDTSERNSRMYRNLAITVVLLIALVLFALWFLKAALLDGMTPAGERPEKERNSHLPSLRQLPKMPSSPSNVF